MKSRCSLSFLVILLLLSACARDELPASGVGRSTTGPMLPTETPFPTTMPETFTALPTLTGADSGLGFVPPATATQAPAIEPTRLPTNTALPALPDYDDVLSFGLGGGGDYWPCAYQGSSPAVFGQKFGLLPRTAILCLWGVTFGDPFQIEMVSPDGQITLTERFVVDPSTQQLQWLDRDSIVIDSLNTSAGLQAEGPFITIGFWWPVNVPLGIWRVFVRRDGVTLAQGEFNAEELDGRRLSVVDPLSGNDIIPVDDRFAHPVKDQHAITGIDVMGDGFSPNSLPVILLYQELEPFKWALVYKSYAPADEEGILNMHIPGPLSTGDEYLLVGIVDAGVPVMDGDHNLVDDRPVDRFNFKGAGRSSINPSINSCPGAPPQRMILNQRGYVCTQRDPVRLRDAPSRAAVTLVSLPVESPFTVVSGPACSDNWSWWQIETDSGYSGWISEGGDAADPYFVCPLP